MATMYVNVPVGQTVNVRAERDINSTLKFTLPRGTSVTASNLASGWYYISSTKGTGYVMAQYLSTTPPGGGGSSKPTLKYGDYGASVQEMQELLLKHGYYVGKNGADKDFGVSTQAAVRFFQSKNGLQVDGVCGANTWNALLSSSPVSGKPSGIPLYNKSNSAWSSYAYGQGTIGVHGAGPTLMAAALTYLTSKGGITPAHVAHSGYQASAPYTTDAYFNTIATSTEFGLKCNTYYYLGAQLGLIMDSSPGALYIARLSTAGNSAYGNAGFVLIAGINPNDTVLCVLPNGTTNSTKTMTQWSTTTYYDRLFVIKK